MGWLPTILGNVSWALRLNALFVEPKIQLYFVNRRFLFFVWVFFNQLINPCEGITATTELPGIGVKDRSITQSRVILRTTSAPLKGGILGRRYSIRPYADLPDSFQYLGNQGGVFLGISLRTYMHKAFLLEPYGLGLPVFSTTSRSYALHITLVPSVHFRTRAFVFYVLV